MPYPATKHASERFKQRGIPRHVLDLLDAFGSSVRRNGADHLIFDKAARERLKAHLKASLGLKAARKTVERWRRVYAVIADNGALLTIAHQTKRIRRDTTARRRSPRATGRRSVKRR